MGQAVGAGLGLEQVAVEDDAERPAVRDVEIGQAGDRDVELHRVDPGPERAGGDAAA